MFDSRYFRWYIRIHILIIQLLQQRHSDMGGGKRQQSCSSENGSSELHTPPPNVVQTEAPIIEGSSTCGGESSADGRTFEIWKLQLILMVDGIGAVLVVSLIQVYFEEISTSPEQYGYMRSIYYIAQICGGLLIGIGSDTIISKRTAIIISAVGSVIGYVRIILCGAASHFHLHPSILRVNILLVSYCLHIIICILLIILFSLFFVRFLHVCCASPCNKISWWYM